MIYFILIIILFIVFLYIYNKTIIRKPRVLVLNNNKKFPEIKNIAELLKIPVMNYNNNEEFISLINYVNENYYTPLYLMAGVFTYEAEIARSIIGDRDDILIMSGGSTDPKLKVLHAIHTDDLAAEAFILFTKINKCKKIHIVPREDLTYAKTLTSLIIQNAKKQELPYEIHKINSKKILIPKNEICICITEGPEMKQFIENNIIEGIIVGSDLAFDFDGTYKNIKTYIMLHAPDDVTSTTKKIYKYIYNKNGYDKYINPYVPFIYDLLARTKHTYKLNDIIHQTNVGESPAALVSTTYKSIYSGPRFGGYWFIQGFPDNDIINTRKNVLGDFPSIKNSSYAEVQIGKFAWAGRNGWNIYYNPYEELKINNKQYKRFMYQGFGVASFGAQRIPIANINNKWYTTSYESIYPLTKKPIKNIYE